MSDGFGIYVHIPFCRRKCGYCDFLSTPLSLTDPDTVGKVIDRIRTEIVGHAGLIEAAGVDPDIALPDITSIYIGGGTPSAVPAEGIGAIISTALESFQLADEVEVTIEVNPETATLAWLKSIREAGANRVSIGAQSMNEAVLDELGRPHGLQDVRDAVGSARAAGFRNLSLDLIYGSPIETAESWRATIDDALALEPEHFSVYGLTLNSDVPMARELECVHGSVGKWELEREDTLLEMHDIVGIKLESAGYPRYEMCSYGPEGYRSRHNLNYWVQGGYLGFGPGAHSHLPAKVTASGHAHRWKDGRSVEDYAAGSGSLISDMDTVDDSAARTEMVFLALRMIEGLNISEYKRRFHSDFRTDFSEAYAQLSSEGLLTIEGDQLSLTSKGWPVADHVMGQLL